MKKIENKDLFLSSSLDGESEFFPLLSDEDEQKIDKEKNPETLPILPLRNTVLFPGVIIPITVTRERSVKLIKEAEKNNYVFRWNFKVLDDVDHDYKKITPIAADILLQNIETI